MTITEGKYTFVLVKVEGRPKEMPQANFKGSGLALSRIVIKDTTEQKECQKTAENKPKRDGRSVECKKNHRWSVVDESLIGTTKII